MTPWNSVPLNYVLLQGAHLLSKNWPLLPPRADRGDSLSHPTSFKGIISYYHNTFKV